MEAASIPTSFFAENSGVSKLLLYHDYEAVLFFLRCSHFRLCGVFRNAHIISNAHVGQILEPPVQSHTHLVPFHACLVEGNGVGKVLQDWSGKTVD